MLVDTAEALDRCGTWASIAKIAESAGQAIDETIADLNRLVALQVIDERRNSIPVTWRLRDGWKQKLKRLGAGEVSKGGRP